MPERTGHARWEGSLQEGKGWMKLGSGAYEGQYSFSSRFEEGTGTNPEELIAAAHAGCFSMALSAGLGRAGFNPTRVETTAKVSLARGEAGFRINRIELNTEAEVPGIDEQRFQQEAQTAKENCPVSKALAGTEITLQARLAGAPARGTA
jgi:osmotically inducible protein OsmC